MTRSQFTTIRFQAMLLAAAFLSGSALSAAPVAPPTAVLAGVIGSDWVVKSEDSVCGVSDANQITNPAKVDYDALMDVTPEMKELRRKKISKTSARGQTLVTAARDRVRRAARSVMTDKGHCSVWKKISHKKRKAVTDLTSAVKAKIKA